jgi:hypothetical protein
VFSAFVTRGDGCLTEHGPVPTDAIAFWVIRMPDLRTIYHTCRPRADVEAGTTKDEQFAADLAQVVNQTAPKEHANPTVFFRHRFPFCGNGKAFHRRLELAASRGATGP